MSLRDILAATDKPLSNGDMQVIEVLLANPQRAVFMPASEVASRASVHESTVTRLAQKLGFAGYPQMRESLREDALATGGLSSRIVDAASSRRHELRALVQNDADALLQLPAYVSQDELTRAAEMIFAARTVFMTGNPYAYPVRAYLERRLRRYGVQVVGLPDSDYEASELLQTMRDGDLLITFAFRRPPSRLSKLLALTHGRGARSLVIADVVGMQLRPSPTQIIAAPRGSDDVFRTPIVPMMIVYALQLSLLHVDPHRCTEALDQLDDVMALLDAEGPANLYTNYVAQEILGDGVGERS